MPFGVELWVITGLTSVLFKSGYQSWQKSLNQRYDSLKLSQTAMVVSLVIFTILIGTLRPSLSGSKYLIYSVLGGSCVGVGIYTLNRAMRDTDLSIASPLQNTIPIFTAIFEPIVLANFGYEVETVVAAVITTLGAYVVAIEPGNPLLPIKRLTKRGPLLALSSAVALATASIITHSVTQNIPILYHLLFEMIGAVTLLTIASRSIPNIDVRTASYGTLFCLTLSLDILTLSLVVASKATVIFRLSLIANVVIGILIYNEEQGAMRILGSLIMLVGILLAVL